MSAGSKEGIEGTISPSLGPELLAEAVTATQRSFTIADLSVPDAPLIFVNPAFERMTGYRNADIAGTNCRFLQGPLTDPGAVKQLHRAVEEQRPVTVTLLNYRQDGSTFWNEVSLAPVFDAGGTATHMVGVQNDVTVQVLAQRDLEGAYASERAAHQDADAASYRLRAILTQLPSGALIAEAPSGRLVSGNEQMERIWRHPFVPAADISEYARYPAFHADGSRYSPEQWPLARSLKTGDVVEGEEMIIERGDGTRGVILAHSAPVIGEDGDIVAAIILFDDITSRKRAEEELAIARERSAALARTLQESLLPADLPVVAGVDFGAAYSPVGEGLDVGGDFYDVFEQTEGEWVLVIGDVMGKGAQAAAVTSLARHALRTAALRARRPATLLTVLNQALLREGTDRPFATVAAGVLRKTAGGAQLTIGLGGHPRPFVLRADGQVHQIGEPGTLMGVTWDAHINEVEVDLRVDDSLIMFTDGVTEARSGADFMGERGLRAILEGLAEERLGAHDLAERIQKEVATFTGGELKDDLAVLVARIADA